MVYFDPVQMKLLYAVSNHCFNQEAEQGHQTWSRGKRMILDTADVTKKDCDKSMTGARI